MAHTLETTNYRIIFGRPPDFLPGNTNNVGAAYLAKEDAIAARDRLLEDLAANRLDVNPSTKKVFAVQADPSSVALSDAAVDRPTSLAEITSDKTTITLYAKYNDGVQDVYFPMAAIPVAVLKLFAP